MWLGRGPRARSGPAQVRRAVCAPSGEPTPRKEASHRMRVRGSSDPGRCRQFADEKSNTLPAPGLASGYRLLRPFQRHACLNLHKVNNFNMGCVQKITNEKIRNCKIISYIFRRAWARWADYDVSSAQTFAMRANERGAQYYSSSVARKTSQPQIQQNGSRSGWSYLKTRSKGLLNVAVGLPSDFLIANHRCSLDRHPFAKPIRLPGGCPS